MTKKIKYILAFSACLVLALASIHSASALDVGSNEITNTIQLSSENPIKIAARVINFFMMFLGIIAVSLIIFAGFKWMTAAGNEENIEAAKKILKNAVIGLVIILSSWGITAFILGQLISNGVGGGGQTSNTMRGGVGLGSGALGSCTVQSVYPEPGQTEVPRNTAIMISFNEELKLDTVCVNAANEACACDNTSNCERLNKDNFRIYEGSSMPNAASSTDAIVRYSSSSRTLVVTPILPLGYSSSNTWYTARLSNDIQATSGCAGGAASCGMFSSCSTDYYRWQFEVSNKLDLTPPQVMLNGIFPGADNERDTITVSSSLKIATGDFKVVGTPVAYTPASQSGAITVSSGNSATIVLENNYNESSDVSFKVTSILGDKAQVYKDGVSAGTAAFNGKSVIFPGYFTLTVDGNGSHSVGQMWTFTISAAQAADTITVGNDTYTFVNATSSGYNIKIDSNPARQAENIALALGRDDVSASINNADNFMVDIQAKVAGFAGNSINLSSSNANVIRADAMHGGSDNNQVVHQNGQKDKPMNSTIQINFNEAINPMTVSGDASEVDNTIQVVNSDDNAKADAASCAQSSECKSYNCVDGKCLGNYVSGKFEISNGYKTVEFRTNNECGMNGCGEKIYCLPADSHLQVKIRTADLLSCSADNDCSTKTPYNACAETVAGNSSFKSCRDANGQNYPTAKTSPMLGIMDAAFNALDGNRDGNTDGPISSYDENVRVATYKDNYRWSFFINSQIEATPPKITSIIPSSSTANANLSDPVVIEFSKLIMSSSLKSGSVKLTVGTTTVEHKLLNLRNAANYPTGYWTTSENLDIATQAGTNQITRAQISHSMFGENISYVSQVGSGVKDIYQNCFKPSTGPGCVATYSSSSCCNGTPESILSNGDCAAN